MSAALWPKQSQTGSALPRASHSGSPPKGLGQAQSPQQAGGAGAPCLDAAGRAPYKHTEHRERPANPLEAP